MVIEMNRFFGLVLMLACASAYAAEVAGVKIDETARVAGTDLKLNGAGLRSKAIFKVYAMGLYLQDKQATPAAILAAPGPKRAHLHMLRDVDADDFSEALNEGVKDNHTEAELRSLAPRLAILTALMNEIKEAKTGLAIDLDWLPGAGTQVTIGGQARGKPIPGEDFYRALLRVWVGDNPVSSDLKKSLLGG
jgi:Chalcone isomerase-like